MTQGELTAVNSDLISAATKKDVSLVAKALDNGAQINHAFALGQTALQISLASEASEIPALLLLYNETNLHSRNEHGETLLHIAIKNGNTNVLRHLLHTEADLKVYDKNGATPLHVAARLSGNGLIALRDIEHVFAAKTLILDEILDDMGRTALYVATGCDSVEHVAQLLRLGCDPLFRKRKPSSGVNTLTSVTGGSESPLDLAVKRGESEYVRMMLRACTKDVVDTETRGSFIKRWFQTAMDLNHHDVVSILLNFDPDLDWRFQQNYTNDTILYYAKANNPGILMDLFSKCCFPNHKLLDITYSVPTILTECSTMLAFNIFKMMNTDLKVAAAPDVIYFGTPYSSGKGSHEAVGRGTYQLTIYDLLVQIVFRSSVSNQLPRLSSTCEIPLLKKESYASYTIGDEGYSVTENLKAREVLSYVVLLLETGLPEQNRPPGQPPAQDRVFEFYGTRGQA